MVKVSRSCFLLLVMVLAVALITVDQVVAQKRCQKVLDPKACTLYDCKKQCFQSFNGNGQCIASGFGFYQCLCVYNC